ncbi:hypothetical protein WKI71_45660 [Streptomyces sp. MS1.AVA.1]|uniref:RAMA domain-containing protein n=1 Tax=Streptomyces machairae TaxID=3134109 RepID=A0ABU8UVX3_9ACTN
MPGQEPQGAAGQINRGRVDKHAKLLADTGDLGREPVYQELRRCAGPSNSRSATPAWKRLNVLLGIIAPGYDQRNPLLREFIKTHKLDKVLRPFGPRETMTSVVQTRQDLYLNLFEHVWNPERLGLPVTSPREPGGVDEPSVQTRAAVVRRRPASGRRRTDVARMIAAQILTPGTRIVLTYRSTDHWATIDEDGGIILAATGGTPYGRVDEAGAVARGTKTCQGMNEWHIEDATGTRISLRALRDRAVASGAL